MTKLKSVTLSNIRRFGSEATIELSPGATILIAPNGTGKTAVFEAIELALTGKINRLGDDLSPIIRDSQTHAQVSLNFDGIIASSRVNLAGEVVQGGDLSAIFPDTAPGDLPYLLRLTHLLDQRERDWLVQTDPKAAGAQLARLPIGRDGAQASTVLAGIRRSLTEQVNQAKVLLAAIEVEQRDWQSLAQERDIAAAQSQGALRTRDTIARTISDIANQTQSLALLPPGLLTEPVRQDSLETVHLALAEMLQVKVARLREQISALTEVDDLIGKFLSDQSQVQILSQANTSAKVALDDKMQERADTSIAHDLTHNDIVLAEQERAAVDQQLEQHVSEANSKQEILQRTAALQEASGTLNDCERACARLRDLHQNNEQLRNQHELLDKQLQSLAQTESDLQRGLQIVELWAQALKRAEVVATEIGLAQERLEVMGKQLVDAVSSRSICETEETQARSNHQTLSSAADTIRQAVASIAAHLPPDRGDCPLCGEPHGAQKLHERVNNALQAIDPSIVEAELRLKSATDQLRASQDAVAAGQTAMQAGQEELFELEADQTNLVSQICEYQSESILASDTLPLAKESVRLQLEANNTGKHQLSEKKKSLAVLPTREDFDRTKNAYELATRSLESARQAQSDASTRLDQATASHAAIIADAPPLRSQDELSADKNRIVQRISDLQAKTIIEQSLLDRQQAQLGELTFLASGAATQFTEAVTRLAALRGTWRQLSLTGDPGAEVARSHEAKLNADLVELERHSESLETIKIEISAWANLEQTRVAQGLLDHRRGGLSEEEFSSQLQKRIDEKRASLGRLTKMSTAMDAFNQYLKQEIENVQKHVVAVVPRWQALLKRIVRDQRFSATKMDFYSAWKKDRAEVSVPLHGNDVPVPAIASEAQLTDLQLTFLLSMAVNHRWSPWKALLLDDPTQHHDLVHASSVFDVLRDYIVDHGFQVVIATHDALQARYFMRKLQNDGIDARIWSLVPTIEGVKAEESQWPGRVSQ
ncbi:AAA family ATPase [Pseudomonas sp. D47]|uniref:AAA family ATPase n=1 Tax=Pseudomonas sp. D47 TaxID=3159447 RepID=UPI00387B6558